MRSGWGLQLICEIVFIANRRRGNSLGGKRKRGDSKKASEIWHHNSK